MNILITGGAGFIGSALVRFLINSTNHKVVNIDKLTYAGNLNSLKSVSSDPRYAFEQIDICDKVAVTAVLQKYRPTSIMHLAAESHVDRSIDGPSQFIQTNMVGTFTMLECCERYWVETLRRAPEFRFLHISTDEVFGSLHDGEPGFTESTPYAPRSPYSASKAGSDHLVQAWHHTYNFPTLMTNCSNNYGPFHFPEKLIPLTILNAFEGKTLPVYGQGLNIRDWLYVDDHVDGLFTVLTKGKVGESYNIGGNTEMRNIDIVKNICAIFDELFPNKISGGHQSLIEFVKDRPGHDFRYAIDASKIKCDLGWTPKTDFKTGIRATVQWYLENKWWWQDILAKKYQGQRLGLKT